MNIKLNHLLSIDELILQLKKNGYTEFGDEKHRLISIDYGIGKLNNE